MSYIVLARKYRPQIFDEIYAQEHITTILQNALNTQRIAHAYLFAGPRGVGKTSMARIFAKSLNCLKGTTSTPCNECHICQEITAGTATDVIEIDGASNTGVEDIRELQRELLYAPSQSLYKIYIIDEVHMLSKNAFNALLKTLEEPPENVIFIFATTEPHKVIPTIISRCLRFDFKRIPVEDIVARMLVITQTENIKIDKESLYIIAQKADGSLRDALSLMDQVLSYCPDEIRESDARAVFGLLPIQVYCNMVKHLAAHDSAGMINLLNDLIGKGSDIPELINGLLVFLRDLLLIRMGINPSELNPDNLEVYQKAANLLSSNNIMYMMAILIQTKQDIKTSSNPILIFEVTMIKLSRMDMMDDIATLLSKLENLQFSFQPLAEIAQSRNHEPRPTNSEAQIHPSVDQETYHTNVRSTNTADPSRPESDPRVKHDAASDLSLPFNESSFRVILPKLTERIHKHSRLTAGNLKECEIAGIREHAVELKTTSPTAYNTLIKNQEMINETASSFFSAPVKLIFILVNAPGEQTRPILSPEDMRKNNPLVERLVRDLDLVVKED